MNESQIEILAESIEGMTAPKDCYILYSLLRSMAIDGDVLEIGSFKGRVTICLAKAVEESGSGKLYAIDANIRNTKECLLSNIAKYDVAKTVIPLFKSSVAASHKWSRALKFIWIDTDLNYFSATCDFMLWEKYLLNGGIIVFSGADVAAVNRVIAEQLINSGRFSKIVCNGAIGYAVKDKQGVERLWFESFYLRATCFCYYSLKRIFFAAIGVLPFVRSDREFTLKRMIKKVFDCLLRVR